LDVYRLRIRDFRAGNAVGVEDEGVNNPPDTGLGGWGSGVYSLNLNGTWLHPRKLWIPLFPEIDIECS
jgi:hypothetical protein